MNNNKLKNMSVYLSGPMDRASDGGVGWRDGITSFLEKMGINVLNPCEKPIDTGMNEEEARQKIDDMKRAGNYKDIRKIYGDIRRIDLRMVDISDFMIAYLNTDIYTCGTVEEIVLANRQKKPVLIWTDHIKGMYSIPNWIYFMLPVKYIFANKRHLTDFLRRIDNGQIETDKRWVFFNRDNNKNINNKVSTYSFTIIIETEIDKETEYIPDSTVDAIYETGCDDTLVGMVDGIISIDFDREAVTVEKAVLSAIMDLQSCGVEIKIVKVVLDDVANMDPQGDELLRLSEKYRISKEQELELNDEWGNYAN